MKRQSHLWLIALALSTCLLVAWSADADGDGRPDTNQHTAMVGPQHPGMMRPRHADEPLHPRVRRRLRAGVTQFALQRGRLGWYAVVGAWAHEGRRWLSDWAVPWQGRAPPVELVSVL